MKLNTKILAITVIVGSASTSAHATTINFNFTGQLSLEHKGMIIGAALPMSASLSYDTVTGIGNSNLSISTGYQTFFSHPMVFHDIQMQRTGDTNIIVGSVLTDWGTMLYDMPLHVEWDATGLFNAIDYGLQANDVLSGSTLYHDANSNGVQDADEFLIDIGSVTPYSDTLQVHAEYIQGPAPMAATANSLGFEDTTPFSGLRGFFDIGSGNSMYVTSVSTVPVPAAVWLFGSGLVGLIGVARNKKI